MDKKIFQTWKNSTFQKELTPQDEITPNIFASKLFIIIEFDIGAAPTLLILKYISGSYILGCPVLWVGGGLEKSMIAISHHLNLTFCTTDKGMAGSIHHWLLQQILFYMIKSLPPYNNFGPSAMCALCVTNCNGQLTLLRLFLSVSLLLSPVFTFLPEGLFLGFWIACKHILTQKYEKMQNNLGSTNKLCKHVGRFKKEFGSKNLGVQKIWVQQFSKLMGKYVVG